MDHDVSASGTPGDGSSVPPPAPTHQPAATNLEGSSWQHQAVSAVRADFSGQAGSTVPDRPLETSDRSFGTPDQPSGTPVRPVGTFDPLTFHAGGNSPESSPEVPFTADPVTSSVGTSAFAASQPSDSQTEPKPGISTGLYGQSDTPANTHSYTGNNSYIADDPIPPAGVHPLGAANGDNAPIAVVEVVSPRGVEYAMMSLALWLGAFSLLGVLLSLINGGTSFSLLSFPASVLIVCLPVFGFFFLRLKKAELNQPSLKLDPSKRLLTQFTQLVAFATCLFTLIAFVYFIMTKISGQLSISFLKALLDVLAVLAVAGGILLYYWFDEHRR